MGFKYLDKYPSLTKSTFRCVSVSKSAHQPKYSHPIAIWE